MRSIYTESRIDSYRYYHLSKESDLTELVPRIPDNFMTKNKYEDSKTPRVVFAPSINQCLMGLSRNLTNEEFYVYTPYLIDLNKLKKPHINQVPDCEITGEVWSTEKIRVKKVGKIKVTKDAGKDGHPYIFGNQQKAELYDWEYRVLIDESTQCFDEISKEDIKRNKLLKPVFIINTYTGSAFANLMKATLKFEYTHALISMDSSLSSMYSYDDNKIVNNKLYKGFIQDDLARYKKDHPDGKMRVTCILVTSEIFDNIMHSINYYKKREKNTAYSVLNLFKWIAGSNKISSWGDLNMFCSEFVDTILKHNNIDITGKSAINTAPDDFGKYTGRNNIFVVFEGAIKDYNYKEVNKKIEDMKKSVEYDRLFAMTSTSMKSRNDITVNKKNHAGEILYNIIKREDAMPYDSRDLQTKKDTEFELPSLDSFKPDIQTLFDNADLKHIWLTSDWHFFKNHYKKEANYVNTREILTWCRKNLGKDDIFVYLGDISFRYANKEDQEQSQKFMASIPAGRKILVLGNHDRMLGDEYYNKCGFDYVVEEFTWNKYLFTHRPVNMDIYPSDWWNIHGHCHNIRRYNTTDGLKNVNVYPKFYNNKPVTLDYLIKHKEELVKNNEWNFNAGYGEATYFIKGIRSGKTLLHEAMIRNNYPKPVVYFSQNINSETIAYMVSLFQDRIGSRVGIKLHFGESGNKNFLNPKLLKDLVKCTNAALIDSNTAYDGSTRGNTSEHIQTAHNNGFDFGFIDILDADGDITISVPKRYQIEHELNELHNGNKKGYESPVSPGRHLQEINVGSHIKNYDSLIVYTHFKGHSLAGYGGALKNIGMGIPSGKVGKKQIHGQGWEKGLIFLERLVESASAIESMFDGKIIYVNVLANISTACDCEKDAPKPIMPNIGVLVSDDIVAIEQASIDLIRNTRKNKDIMEQIAKLGGFHQIEYMKFLGMGRSDYRLKSLNGETIKLESALHHENNMYTINDSIIRKAISAINAEYKKYDTVSRAGNQNCLLCTWCLEAQLRGYNVLPRPVFSPRDPIFTIDASSLINAEKIGFRSLNELIRIIKESENYSRFYTHVNWNNSSGGHEFLLANIDGSVKVLDAQAGLYTNIESSQGHEYFDDINYQNSYIVKWSDGEIDMQKLYRYNNKAKIVRWNDAEDIAYLKANNMISDESAILFSELATSIEESRFTKFKDDYSKNTSKHLSDFTKIKVDDEFVSKHKDIAKDIKNQGLDYNKDVAYVWMNKNDKWVAKLYIDNTDYGDGKKWIAMIEVSNGYRGCGLGKELVMHAINVDKCDALGVHKDNKVAIKLYESCGFKISDEAKERVNSGKDKYYWMYRNGAPKPGMYHSSNYDENAIQEGYIKDEPDLYWRRKEFNEGKINLCFITGLSGSGKSTMGADMAGKPNVDHCDMDNVVFNCNFDDKELSELGEMINAFFKGPGRQYRLKKGDLQSVTNNHRTKISNALVDFAIKYAASHKNTKFIVEGVYLFWMVSPEKLKDCAVYIKGTSSIKSAIRAAKRDGGMQDNTKDKVIVFSKTLAKKFYGMTYNTGNIDRWRRYYQALQDKEEKSMKEAYIFNKKDIYYNRNKFNNGETNLCFITGQSGSGKSTMGKHMQGRCEVYDLDDVIWNKESFTMENFKEYGELIYTFFNGKGKKYYLTAAELKGEKPVQDGIPKPKNNWDYEHDLINDFVNYAISWAKSHKDIKYVLEGIWIYMYIEPSKLKDYAVYIKGTSMLTSIYRASKRDNRFRSNILHPGMWIDGEKGLKKYRDYFEPRSEESIHEVKRSDLPDSVFGIPEDRKFPLDTEQHVKSAIHLFGHAEESKKKSLAKKISSAAKKYDIRIPETTQVYKYLNESVNEIIPDGIENIIFDMGKVLVDANTLDALYDNANIPDEYCEEIRDFINEKLFYASDIESKRKIQGYNLEQIRDYLTKALPEHLSPYMDDILDTLKPAMFTYSYVPEMLDLLRSMGYKLYYLSNWDRYSYDLEKEFFDPLLEQFDGGLFSFELGEVLKPDREMYEALCEKYHIFANKSIFFDDMEENIEAARSVGMAAYKFDKDITPKILFGTCVRIPDNSDDLILIANGDDGFTKRHISEFGWWYLDESRTPSGIDEEYYYKTLDDAIKYKVDKLISQDAFTDDSPNVLEYVYTNAKAFCEDKTPPEAVCVGQILLYESGGYEWVVQYPLKMENRILCGLKEFSMASVNPVIGINKPFLIKVGDQNHPELLPTDHFVYSQDIESDKVLTVDDDNHLKVKKVKDLDIIEAYEFVGDMAYIHRLNKLYKENAEVSNLYTLLTNKPMLTEDQIDFDPSFKRIDFDLLKQKELAEMVTLRDNLMEAMNYNPLRLPVLESAIIKKPSFLSKYNTAGDISIKEDFDGVYFYSDITKKRSASAASTLQLTENMLRAIL